MESNKVDIVDLVSRIHEWLTLHWGEGPIDGDDLELVELDRLMGEVMDEVTSDE